MPPRRWSLVPEYRYAALVPSAVTPIAIAVFPKSLVPVARSAMFFWLFSIVAIVMLAAVLLHMAMFGGVFYTILRQIQQRQRSLAPQTCAHCGTVSTGMPPTCPRCGAPFDANASPLV
jgi:uncharacterized paraquat-inducible protein A